MLAVLPFAGRTLSCAALALAVLATSGAARDRGGEGQDDAPREPGLEATAARAASTGIDAATREALERGLAWLAENQSDDGSFPTAGGKNTQHVPIASTAVGTLAFLAAGHGPDRGPHGRVVAKGIDYLLQHADMAPGAPYRGYVWTGNPDDQWHMHGHGLATIALAESFAVSPRTRRGKRIAEVLSASVDLIEASQSLEGGWYYRPGATTEHENSVTVCLVQALRAARNAGVRVDSRVIERAIEYIRRCQEEDGSFRYALTTGKTSIALTAAGIATLNAAGEYGTPAVERAMEALWQRIELRKGKRRWERVGDFPFYERFYVAQALWQHEDPRLFGRWFEELRPELLEEQRADGSWSSDGFGRSYATGMTCLVLALPDGLLPIFQR